MDETIGRSSEKAGSKRPMIEIPDMNEEILTFQPERSSTDSKELSISTVHSLNAEHLFPVGEHPSKPDFSFVQDPPDGNNDQNSRWIKRLRVSSNEYCVGTKNSDIGEPSAHKRYCEFLNKIMISNVPTGDSPKNSDSPLNCPIDGVKNYEHSCPWVQRWWKDTNFGSNNLSLKTIDPHVFCGLNSLQLGVDELGKRQFPSIGAMALMGKTMNGFRSCEITKKGSVFVWNTKDY